MDIPQLGLARLIRGEVLTDEEIAEIDETSFEWILDGVTEIKVDPTLVWALAKEAQVARSMLT